MFSPVHMFGVNGTGTSDSVCMHYALLEKYFSTSMAALNIDITCIHMTEYILVLLVLSYYKVSVILPPAWSKFWFGYFWLLQIIAGLNAELNRLYSIFCERHPYFEANNGKVSICAHSLGSVIMYDILTGWDPIELYDQYVSNIVVSNYNILHHKLKISKKPTLTVSWFVW